MEQYKSALSNLEAEKLHLNQQVEHFTGSQIDTALQVADLTAKLEEQGATFRSQVGLNL